MLLCIRCIYYIAFSFLAASLEVYMLLFICFLCGPLIPMIRSFLANSVPLKMQSKVQATFGALQTVVMLLANVIVAIYSETIDILPGLTYWVIAFVCLCGAISAGLVVFREDIRRNIPDLDGHLPVELMGLDAAEPLLLLAASDDTEALLDDKIKHIDNVKPMDASDTDHSQILIDKNVSNKTREAIPALYRKRL